MTFEEFYSRYQSLVRKVVDERLSGPMMAERDDVFNETMFKVWRSFDRIEDGNQAAWVARIAINTAYDHLRSAHRPSRQASPLDVVEMDEILEDPRLEDQILQTERQDFVRFVLDRLSKDQSEVLCLSLQGHTGEEISAIIGLSRASVCRLLRRARASAKAMAALEL